MSGHLYWETTSLHTFSAIVALDRGSEPTAFRFSGASAALEALRELWLGLRQNFQ